MSPQDLVGAKADPSHLLVQMAQRLFAYERLKLKFSYISRVAIKSVFGVPDRVRQKPGCTAPDKV